MKTLKVPPLLNFYKDPVVLLCITLIIFLGSFYTYLSYIADKAEGKKPKVEALDDLPLSQRNQDTTQWRKLYYEHLYYK